MFAHPPAGVTFALPHADLPAPFRAHVLQTLKSANWNRYVEQTGSSVRKKLADRWGVSGHLITLTHGADDAIFRVAQGFGPKYVAYPQWGYPGYNRATIGAGARAIPFRPDARAVDVRASLAGHGDSLLYLCWPGNPIGNIDQVDGLNIIDADAIVVDLTYMNPLSLEFAELLRSILNAGASAAFSFSKTLALAGARLGGFVTSSQNPLELSPQEHFPWNVFQFAIGEALLDPANAKPLEEYFGAQVQLRDDIEVAARTAGLRVVSALSSCFVSVETTLPLRHSKQYPQLGITRLDVNPEVLCDLRDLLEA